MALKEQKHQDRTVPKASISEDIWTTSTRDMDNSAVQSRGSISSVGASNNPLDAHGTGSGNISSEFVNNGKLLLIYCYLFLFPVSTWPFMSLSLALLN